MLEHPTATNEQTPVEFIQDPTAIKKQTSEELIQDVIKIFTHHFKAEKVKFMSSFVYDITVLENEDVRFGFYLDLGENRKMYPLLTSVEISHDSFIDEEDKERFMLDVVEKFHEHFLVVTERERLDDAIAALDAKLEEVDTLVVSEIRVDNDISHTKITLTASIIGQQAPAKIGIQIALIRDINRVLANLRAHYKEKGWIESV